MATLRALSLIICGQVLLCCVIKCIKSFELSVPMYCSQGKDNLLSKSDLILEKNVSCARARACVCVCMSMCVVSFTCIWIVTCKNSGQSSDTLLHLTQQLYEEANTVSLSLSRSLSPSLSLAPSSLPLWGFFGVYLIFCWLVLFLKLYNFCFWKMSQ